MTNATTRRTLNVRADLVREVERAERALVDSACRSGSADFGISTPVDFLAVVRVPADLVQNVMRARAALAVYDAPTKEGTSPR